MDTSSGQSGDAPLDHPILGIPAIEDQGVVAGEGFGFQYDCIAKCAIKMLSDESLVLVVCETHEDSILIFSDSSAELVSCKARSPSKPYTVPALLSDGGVLHLFDRWDYTGREARCRVMTDGALKDGDAKQLQADCHSREPAKLAAWAEKLKEQFGASADDVAAFLGGLTIDTGHGPRDKLGEIIAFHFLRPHIKKAKLAVDRCLDYYRVILGEVERRCQTAAADPWEEASLLAASRDPERAAHRARLRTRSLDRAQVEACLYGPPPEMPLDASPDSVDHTRMVAKLERGDVGPVGISAAKRLRASWYALEEARKLRAPGAHSGFEDLRARVLLIAAAAERQIDREEPYGERLYEALAETLTLAALQETPVAALTDEHLLGLIFQLTDECELFFSQRFDVEAALE